MKASPRLFGLALVLLPLLLVPLRAQAFGWPNDNDSIFPPLPAAKPYINFDGKGFLIDGKRTFIAAGELQYPRTPRAMWRSRLLEIKRAGYNTIQTYAFWNYHEPQEGKFEFTGEKDFDAFLKTVHSLGMYAIVRMGPYVNAEWDTGGLPVWLRFNRPGLRPMTDNAEFYHAVDPYYAKLVPILVANQINHGGPILMVQLENEHRFPRDFPAGPGVGGGTDLPNAYYHRFYDKMRRMGLQVPLFFSGLNHNDDPAGDTPFDISQRTSPWYSTEFWTGWVKRYGTNPERSQKLERTTWKVIAYGGAGYTHYTMAGGTDFDTWNNDEQAASYDFGSPIGQTGDLRDVYYRCKRAAMFATSFAGIISNSLSAAGGDGSAPTNAGVLITNRKGPKGEILFLDNNTGVPAPTQIKTPDGKVFPSAGPITLAPGEIMPVVKGFPLGPGVNLELGAARILGVADQGATTTLVIYGAPGEPAELHFGAANAKVVQQPAGEPAALTVSGSQITLKTKFPAGAPSAAVFRVGSRRVRILAMGFDMADRTWFLQGGSVIACGPDYVGEVQETGGALRLATEQRGLEPNPHPLPFLLYREGPPVALHPISLPNAKVASPTPPALGAWEADSALPQVQPGYDDSGWKASAEPLAMGADGDISAYAWYRTSVTVPKAGAYQLSFTNAKDWITCFVNGVRGESSDVRTETRELAPRRLPVTLKAGQNTLAFLTAHYGRNKLFNYYGPMDTIDAKGISGTVTLSSPPAQTADIAKFRWQADDQAPTDATTKAAPGLSDAGADWQDATTATDAFHGRVGWAWFRTTLPDVSGPHRLIHFNSIDDMGQVFLNGQKIASDVGVNAGVDVSLDSAWLEGKPNVLAVAVQNTAGGGGMNGAVTLAGGIVGDQEIKGWKMRGGAYPPPAASAVWKPLSGAAGPGVPAFYRTTFTDIPPGVTGPHPILRALPQGMSRGFVWLNGRNLGRYPEKSPVDGLYLPESILRPGQNSLVVFDEDGASPAQMKIIVEAAASRIGSILVPSGGARTTARR